MSHVAYFPDCESPILLLCVEIFGNIEIQCVHWGLSYKMRNNDKLKNFLVIILTKYLLVPSSEVWTLVF